MLHGVYIMLNQLLFNEYANRNHASIGQLINDLYAYGSSKLLVVRVDFLYRPEFREQASLEVVQEHRRRILDNRRRNMTLFSDLLGYAWRLEYGVLSGFHHHFIFFYDGHKRREDISLGLGIANYFDTVITQGMTHSYVSNTDKLKFEQAGTLGIGAIAHNEINLRNYLLDKVAGYLTKGSLDDGYRECLEDGTSFRSFGRSESPQPRPEGIARLGRPRNSLVMGI